VMVVDDDDYVRTALVHPLKHAGYTVVDFGDPREALAWFGRSDPPDLVVTDVVMPGLNGKQLADACRRVRPGTPVLFITGYSEDVVFLRGVDHHAELLLEKPFSPSDLVDAVERLLRQAVPSRSEAPPAAPERPTTG
jgi:two-component system cell cycle sensor histidine kinase/response regulator CckA